ncbi:MAG: penicillin-binding transpeptidase domain-containing protein [Chloroflexi bacterium]|nr:penicillin-binding transpeptidase domain-containing protein [Chloroflexota bacterium]
MVPTDTERIARRHLLRGIAVTAASAGLAACSSPLTRNQVKAKVTLTDPPTDSITAQDTTLTTASTSTRATTTAFAIPQGPPAAVSRTYLAAWNTGQYDVMYKLITHEAQTSITQQRFVERYRAIAEQATITKVQATLDPGQHAESNIQHFTVIFDTVLVGRIEQHNTLTLAVEADGKTWRIQWLPALIFQQLSGANLIHMEPKGTPRGSIVDRNGTALATLGTVATVYLKPSAMKDEPVTLAALSKLLGLSEDVIRERYLQTQVDTSVVLRTLALKDANAIRSALEALPGVSVVNEPARVYPYGPTASQTIGYVSTVTNEDLRTLAARGYRPGDVIGRLGIEKWGEQYLAGQWGGTLSVVTPKLGPVSVIAQREPGDASTVHLTLDLPLQQFCEHALSGHRGAIGVIRTDDGSLLALASTPQFDPNAFILGIAPAQYYQLVTAATKPMLNRVVEASYPADQLFLPVTAAAALEGAGYTPDASFFCPGYYDYGGIRFPCWKTSGHGRISLVQALAQSCDVAAYTMGVGEDHITPTLLPDLAQQCGFGTDPRLTGLDDAPQRAAGLLPTPKWKSVNQGLGWLTSDSINLADGRGFLLVTPLQMLTFFAAVANGGTIWTPRVVDRVVDPSGAVRFATHPTPRGKLPLSPGTLAILRQGLSAAVKSGQGRLSQVFSKITAPVAGMDSTARNQGTSSHVSWCAAYFTTLAVAVVATLELDYPDASASTLMRDVLLHIGETSQRA